MPCESDDRHPLCPPTQTMHHCGDSLPLAAKERVDQICLAFEDAWKSGPPPEIEAFLADREEPERSALLRELLHLELHYRGAGGERPVPDTYRGRFPEHGPLIEGAFQEFFARANRPPGTRIRYLGDYELLEVIGQGGMGVVYRARQLSLNRVVAVKMIRAGHLATEEEVERFHREAEAAANLDHPGIVPIFEVGQYEGQHYYSMGYVDGSSLADRIVQGPMEPRDAGVLVASAAEAVHYSHQLPVYHRDLKPSNILVDREGRPRIIDFGLAKWAAGGSELTATTQVVGTPSYMSPEQAAGGGSAIGPATDVYGLGAVLYALLTGRPPFQAANPSATLSQVLEQEPVAPRQLNPQVPRDLETVTLKCLEKDPRRRYATAQDLAHDLNRYLAGEPIRARPVGQTERLWRWCKRKPLVAVLTVGVAVSLLAGALVSGYFAVEAHARAREAVAESIRADKKAAESEANAQRADKEKEAARGNLYNAHMNLVQQALERRQHGHALALLESYRYQLGQQDLRGFEWYYLWRKAQERLRVTLRGHREAVLSVACSPDGKTVASASADGTVRLWDLSGWQQRVALYEHGRPVVRVAFAPDGKTLASGGRDGTVILRDARTGVPRRVFRHDGLLCLAFSPDSMRLSTAGGDRTVRLWDANTGKSLGRPMQHGEWPHGLAFAPDGKMIASTDYGRIRVWDVAAGHQRNLLQGHRTLTHALAFSVDGTLVSAGDSVKLWDAATGEEKASFSEDSSAVCVACAPDAKRLAYGCDDGSIVVRDLVTGQKWAYAHADAVLSIAFSPDGSTLVSGSRDRTIRLWNVSGPPSPPAAPRAVQVVWSVAFSPDGKTLASVGDERVVKLWDVATGEARAVLEGHTGPVVGAAFSPDGDWLATGGDDQTIRLWDCRSGAPRAVLNGHSASVYSLAFSPDGKTLASGGGDRTVLLWETGSWKTRATLKGHRDWVWSLAFSADGKLLASTENSGAVKLWDGATGEFQKDLPGICCVNAKVAISPDDTMLAAVDSEGRLVFWDRATGQVRAALAGHVKCAHGLAFFPDGRTVAACSSDGAVMLWDALRRQERITLRWPGHGVECLALSPDGKTLATGSTTGEVKFWRAASEREVADQSNVSDYRAELARRQCLHGRLLWRMGQEAEAEHSYRRAVELYELALAGSAGGSDCRQEMAETYSEYACLLETSRDPKLRDWPRVAALATKAVELEPQEGRHWLRVGAAWYRAGKGKEAVAALEKAMALRNGGGANDQFYMAMAQHQLGNAQEAKKWYMAGLQQMRASTANNEALLRLGDEAATLLQIPVRARTEKLEQWLEKPPNPPCTPVGKLTCLDLQPKANWRLDEPALDNPGNDLRELPQGEQKLAGVTFKIGAAVIQLGSRNVADKPAKVEGIAVGAAVARVYVLHATQFGGLRHEVPDGTLIGQYRLHYEDGTEASIPIVCGVDVRDWWNDDDSRPVTRGKLAWTGTNEAAKQAGCTLRLYLGVWANPTPEKKVATIDYVSTNTRAAPFCVAITAEGPAAQAAGGIPAMKPTRAQSDHPPAADLPPGPALWMTFEKDSVAERDGRFHVQDLSGFGNHGLGTGVTGIAEGKIREGLACKGGELELPNGLLTDLAAYTVAGWVYRNKNPGGLRLYSEYGRRGAIVYEIVVCDGGFVRIGAWNKATPDNWMHATTPPGSTPTDQWFFLAVRLDAHAQKAENLTIKIDDSAFEVALQPIARLGGGTPGIGALDEVVVYQRALSDAEIERLYQRGREAAGRVPAIRAAGRHCNPM